MGFLSQIANVFTGSEDAKAAKKAGRIQQEAAQSAAEGLRTSGEALQPFQQVGQRGVDLSGFLGDPSQQSSFLESNPLFQLGLQNLNEQTQQSAASRGRLTAGDTLQQLQQNAQLAGQPLIDRQRQDILNLLNIGQGAAGQQIGLEGQIQDLLTSGSAAKAAGVVGAQNARTQGMGNLVDLATTAATMGAGGPTGAGLTGASNPVSGFGSGLNLSQQPLGINLNAGSFQ